MESIEQMIKRLCPKGVEYVKLGEVASIKNGRDHKKYEDGDVPVYGSGGVMRHIETFIYNKPSVLLPRKGSLGNVLFVDEPFWTVDTMFWTVIDRRRVNEKFLFYYLKNYHIEKLSLTNGGAVPSLTQSQLNDILVPLPPLEIQSRIVEVLDKMTTLTAELEARKQQYEYYRNKLLTFNETGGGIRQVTWKRLGDLLYSIRTGLNPRKFFSLNTPDATNFYVTIKEFKGGNLVFGNNTDMINDEAMRLCNNRSHLEEGDLLFSGTGTIGEVLIVKETPRNWNIKEGVYALKPKSEEIKVEYLKHIMQNSSVKAKLESLSEGGTVKSISMKKLADFVIPVPSMQEQQRIVSILDRFEALTTDLQSGLPAEIEARRQQYEYYRNKLLTFEAV